MHAILGRNGDKAAVDMLLVEGCRLEEKGRKTPGEAEGLERDSWDEPCFCVCQPAVEVCWCCCWRMRSFRTCFSLKEKYDGLLNILKDYLLDRNKVVYCTVDAIVFTFVHCFAAKSAGCNTGWAGALPSGLVVMTGCWVTHCTDLSARFATYKRVSVEEKGGRGEKNLYLTIVSLCSKRQSKKAPKQRLEQRTMTTLTIPPWLQIKSTNAVQSCVNCKVCASICSMHRPAGPAGGSDTCWCWSPAVSAAGWPVPANDMSPRWKRAQRPSAGSPAVVYLHAGSQTGSNFWTAAAAAAADWP